MYNCRSSIVLAWTGVQMGAHCSVVILMALSEFGELAASRKMFTKFCFCYRELYFKVYLGFLLETWIFGILSPCWLYYGSDALLFFGFQRYYVRFQVKVSFWIDAQIETSFMLYFAFFMRLPHWHNGRNVAFTFMYSLFMVKENKKYLFYVVTLSWGLWRISSLQVCIR